MYMSYGLDWYYCCQVFIILLWHLYVNITEEWKERRAPPPLIRRQCDESVAIEQHYFVVLFSLNWIICVSTEVWERELLTTLKFLQIISSIVGADMSEVSDEGKWPSRRRQPWWRLTRRRETTGPQPRWHSDLPK